MEEKLDLKDRKLYYLLTENSRLKLQEIASRIRLSKNAVIYRMNRLVKEGYILKFLPITDFQKLGVFTADVFLKINFSKNSEEKFKNYFREHPNVIWATTLFGVWDLFIQMATKNIDEFEKLLEEMIIFIGKDLEDYEVKFFVKRIKIDRRVFDYEKETGYKFKRPKVDYSKKVKLDELDKKILRHLNAVNGLASYKEVSDAVGESLETARNRMIALFSSGLIVKYAPMIGYEKLGFIRYLVMINFHYLTKEFEQDVYNYLKFYKDAKIVFKTSGKQEVYFYAVVRNPKELEILIKDMKNRFSDIILNIDQLPITEELKLDFFPKALENI